MSDLPLNGKKIAVLVESQYVPGEIKIYQERFASYGATVELVSRLWGQAALTFYSTVEEAGQQPETLTVTTDVDSVQPEDYAAIIMAANYTSVRLRYAAPPAGQVMTPETIRTAPAVRFFAAAMGNPDIIKGAPCHALWLLTPMPELLAGRMVTCNAVVLSDIHNAGAIYVAPEPGSPDSLQICIDQDLVTSTSWHASATLVDAIRDLILARSI
jgi:protease I